jgi:zinc protease
VAAPVPVELPPIEQLELPNGLRVFIVKSERLPVVSMQLAIRAGRMHEPRSRLGVAELTADMLVKGTARRDAAALAKAIDFVGGTIAIDATFEATLLSCSVLRRSLGTCLELVPEMLTQPAFPEAELARTRDAIRAQIRSRFDDPAALASQHVQNLLWGPAHVRGWVPSEDAIASLRREDLIAWHKAWYVPNNALLVIAGDVDPVRVKADLQRAFGGWKRTPVSPAPTYKEPGLSGSRIRLVDRPGLGQVHLRIAQLGIKHEDPRFFDTLVWNTVLGGGAGSRLARAARPEGGRLLGASSSFDRNLDRGSFVVQAVARPDQAIAGAKLLLGELAKLAKDGPTQDEITAAVASLAGGYGLRFQAVSDVGAALIGAELHNFGREYLANFPIAVGRVDAASARQAASEIVDARAYVLVIVGDAKDLEPQLKKEGWRYDKVPFNATITAPEAPPELPIDPKQAEAARKLIDEAVAAKGGKARLAALKGFRMVAVGTTTAPPRGGTVPVEIERVMVLPDRMRIDATLDGRIKVSIAASGRTGWQVAPDQSGKPALVEFTPEEMAQIEVERWREPELILLKALEPGAKLYLTADEAIGGQPHAVVKLRTPFGGLEVTLYVDRKTKLISKLTYSEGRVAQTDELSDYRDVGGLKIAHKRHSTGGRETTIELRTVELDPKVDPKLFDKPAAAPAAGAPTTKPATPAPATPAPAAPAPAAAAPKPATPAPAAPAPKPATPAPAAPAPKPATTPAPAAPAPKPATPAPPAPAAPAPKPATPAPAVPAPKPAPPAPAAPATKP